MDLAQVTTQDLDLFVAKVTLRSGVEISVEEFTLGQRDRFFALLTSLAGEDAALKSIAAAFAGKDGGDIEFDAIGLIKGILQVMGEGALTRIVGHVVDIPSNKDLFGGTPALDWVKNNVRLTDEQKIVKAMLQTNDVAAYVKNWASLLPKGLGVTARPEGAKTEAAGVLRTAAAE